MSRRGVIFLSLWLAAVAAAVAADRPVAQAVKDRGWDNKKTWTRNTVRATEALKVPGEYGALVAVAVVLAFAHPARWRAAVLLAGAGALSGLNSVLKWVVGRHRPVVGVRPFDLDAFVGGWAGLFGSEKNLSFPSGHAALAFALASALAVCLPRWRVAFYAVAVVVGLERIGENAHYVSDTVAGAAVGVLATQATQWLCRRYVPDWAGHGLPPGSDDSTVANATTFIIADAPSSPPAASNPQSAT